MSKSPRRDRFQVSAITAGCLLALVAAGTAQAQQQLDTVVVTGIRKGIEDAISVKKNKDNIVEAISAEDIGKLPDTSIAESIARLPGLAAQRVNGRAQEIQIRGLAGQFATTLLNGREQVSTGDNRSAEFDQYPSELLSGVTIYKTPDGALVGQGLSGTVDLQTVRPLSFGKRTVALNLRGEKNSLGKLNAGGASDTGKRFSASYIDQFADRTFGVAIGLARLESPNQNEYYRSWGYPTGSGSIVNGGVTTTYNNVRLPGGVQVRAESAEQTRDGLMAVLQWKPSKEFESVLDVYHSKFERIALQRGFEAGLAWSGASLQNPVVEGATAVAGQANTFTGGVLTKADYVGAKPIFRHDHNEREDKINAIGWNNKLVLGDWTLVGDISWSKADRNESILELYSGTVPGSAGATDTFNVVLPQGGGYPIIRAGLNYADPAIIRLVDSGGWGQAGYLKNPEVKDEIKSLKLAARSNADMFGFTGFDLGVNYTEREKSRNVPEWFLDLKASPQALAANEIVGSTSLAFVGMPSMVSYDPRAALGKYYNLRPHVNQRDILNKIWTVNEEITTGFVKGDIETELFGLPVRGNLGLQAVHTKQSSTAFRIEEQNLAARTTQTLGTSYTDFLPSLNLSFQLPGDQALRVALARQIARPRMDDLRATQIYDVDLQRLRWTGNGGNPELKPWKADALDVSWEKYFGRKGYVSVAGYYKDLKTYIYQQRLNVDFTQRFPGLTPPTGKPTPGSPIGEYETQANGEGGSLSGLELAASVPLDLITNMLDGFGVQFSYAYVDSKIQPFGPGDVRPLPGLSRNTYNLTAYYEKNGFQVRVSGRLRDSFVGEITGFGANREFQNVEKEQITDAQIGYEFQSGSMKGLALLLQVNNLGNEPYVEYLNSDPTQTRQYTKYGRTYLVGASYRF